MQRGYQSLSGKLTTDSNQRDPLGYSSRKPQRITITVSHFVHEVLVEESLSQGRSLSNLASFWLELQAELARKRKS